MDSPPPTLLKTEDRLMIVLCHLSVFLGVGLILPLVIYLIKKADSPMVTFHARETLNFHLSVLIYLVCCIPLVFIIIGVFVMIAISLATAVFAIIGAVRSADGAEYLYPLTIRMVK